MATDYKLLQNTSKVLTLSGNGSSLPRCGKEMNDLRAIDDGAIVFSSEGILAVGKREEICSDYPRPEEVIDADGNLVLPGFVDCHTHLVYAGDRSSEMLMRLQGATYLDILKAGGGINKTVMATRDSDIKALTQLGKERLDWMMAHGTTTVEIKSGYGLNEETEEKILQVAQLLGQEHPMDIFTTYLGAHTVPKDVDRIEYLNWLAGSSLEKFKKLATYFDVFCEEGAFSSEETLHLLRVAKQYGFLLKLHAGQFHDLGVCGKVAEMGAVSIDHLDHINDDDLSKMAAHKCVGVLLPGVPFFLKTGIFPDARRFRERGVPFALATDFNPGSCPSYSMAMMVALAVLECHATLEEAICGATINAACALNAGDRLGSLETGKQADIQVLNVKDYFEIPYYFGANLTKTVIKKGKVVW